MPLYEYVCNACGCEFELLRRFSQADAPAECPQCQRKDARRLMSRFSAISQGSDGSTTRVSGGSSCASCGSGSCAGCGG